MKKILSLVLSICMLLSMLPMTVQAESAERWDVLTFSQNGPEFSVIAEGFSALDSAYTFEAIAYDGDEQEVDAKIATATIEDGNLTASVDFEENGEADASIAKVLVNVKNSNGEPVTEAQTFAITAQQVDENGVYNNLTNGFYKPVLDGVTASISGSTRYVWNSSNSMLGGWAEGSSGAYNLYDQNPSTRSANGGGIGAGNHAQYIGTLSASAKIDRVVVYVQDNNAIDFYLAKTVDTSSAGSAAHLARFAGAETDDEGLCYLGNCNSGHATESGITGVTRLLFDTDGDSFKYLISDITGSSVYALYEFAPYQKVVATKTIVLPFDLEAATNVALDASAFAYGSAEGTTPAFAVDGNASTAWVSANNSDYRDQLILDLGAAYTVGAITLTLAEGSDQNIVVYGMNTGMNDERNSEITQNVSATEFTRTPLTASLNALEAGENVLDSLDPSHPYRYIVIEQAAGTNPALAIAEIGIYTADEAAADHVASGVVAQAKASLGAFTRYNSYDNQDNEMATAAPIVLDADPSTNMQIAQLGWQWNGQVSHAAILDLGMKQKVSHLVYQGATSEESVYPYQNKYFLLVGADTLPSGGSYTNLKSGSYDIDSLNVDVLARYDGGTNTTAIMSGKGDSGLLVFEVPEEYQDKSYRYVGLLKIDPEGDSKKVMRTIIGTLQAYTSSDSLAESVEATGAKKIVDFETVEITESELTYSTGFWNGYASGNLVGILTQYDEDGSVLTESQYIDCGYLSAGAYNEMEIALPEAAWLGVRRSTGGGGSFVILEDYTKGRWELVIVSGTEIYDYITDLAKLTRAKAFSGSEEGTAAFKQIGNNVQITGKVDAGTVGMLILKPDAASPFTAEDIYAHVLSSAAAEANGAWNYALRYVMPEDAPGTPEEDFYTACVISDSGALCGETFSISIFDVEEIVESFAEENANVVEIVNENSTFFGEEIVADVAATENFNASFAIAKEGFMSGNFDENLTDWSSINTNTAAVQAALIIDATFANENVAETIETYGAAMPAVFNDANYDGEEFEDILPSVMDSIEPETAEEIVNAYKRTIALSLIAGGSVAEREEALTDYSGVLGITEDTLDTDQEMLSIAKKLSNNIQTVKNSYADGMNSVVSSIIKDLNAAKKDNSTVLGNNNSGGGGSGRGNSNSIVAALPYDLWDEEESTAPSKEPESAITIATGFNDVDNHAWAHSAIKTMKERGIINGVDETSFAPDALLTREQTAKLLVLTLNLKTTIEDNGYRDCTYGAWYYPFVSAAKQHGLINGFSRTEFGLGQNITREDLAVMIYRAMEKLELTDASLVKSFADDASVSEYAKTAVSALGGMGLITGYEDGSFGPKDNATRAQATVIFARFLDMYEAAQAAKTVDEEG